MNLKISIPRSWLLPAIVLGGVVTGLGAYTVYVSRAYSYLSDNPSACVNCHIMTPYHQSWMHSSHARWTNCNDCHVPHENAFKKYLFKAKDGLYHAAVFTMRKEPMAIRPREESAEVIRNNCIRCHSQLDPDFVKNGMLTKAEGHENEEGGGPERMCWDCHRNVPHGTVSSLASSPNAPLAPLPKSPVPAWLKQIME